MHPYCKQIIFSVQSVIIKCTTINFLGDKCELKTFDGTTFNFNQKNNLYFLKIILVIKKIDLIHYLNDIINLQNKVRGINITGFNDKLHCDICTLGKMNNLRHRKDNAKARNILCLFH